MAENTTHADGEETPEVEAHSEKVLGLQGMTIEEALKAGVLAPGSCSSCVGSFCN